MHIREYQQWLEEFDRARGWDQVDPAHTLVHAMEEMGEVARLLLQWEGYKGAQGKDEIRAGLREELNDLLVFLFKVAYQTGVDVEDALEWGQRKVEMRYGDLDFSRSEMERYQARQSELGRQAYGDNQQSKESPTDEG